MILVNFKCTGFNVIFKVPRKDHAALRLIYDNSNVFGGITGDDLLDTRLLLILCDLETQVSFILFNEAFVEIIDLNRIAIIDEHALFVHCELFTSWQYQDILALQLRKIIFILEWLTIFPAIRNEVRVHFLIHYFVNFKASLEKVNSFELIFRFKKLFTDSYQDIPLIIHLYLCINVRSTCVPKPVIFISKRV